MGGYVSQPMSRIPQITDHSTGGSLTSVVGSFENLDAKGHGVKLEVMSMMVRPFQTQIISTDTDTS